MDPSEGILLKWFEVYYGTSGVESAILTIQATSHDMAVFEARKVFLKERMKGEGKLFFVRLQGQSHDDAICYKNPSNTIQ